MQIALECLKMLTYLCVSSVLNLGIALLRFRKDGNEGECPKVH